MARTVREQSLPDYECKKRQCCRRKKNPAIPVGGRSEDIRQRGNREGGPRDVLARPDETGMFVRFSLSTEACRGRTAAGDGAPQPALRRYCGKPRVTSTAD